MTNLTTQELKLLEEQIKEGDNRDWNNNMLQRIKTEKDTDFAFAYHVSYTGMGVEENGFGVSLGKPTTSEEYQSLIREDENEKEYLKQMAKNPEMNYQSDLCEKIEQGALIITKIELHEIVEI